MGKKNLLTLTLTSKDGDKNEYNYKLDFSNYSIDTPNKLKVTYTKDDEVTDGLFAILGDSREDNDYIHLVDNDGIVRSEIPIIGYRGLRLLFNNNNMYFNISEKRLVSDGVKYFVVDIKKEIIQCYNKFENKKQKDGFYEYYNKIK